MPVGSVADPLRVEQWGLDAANIPAAWSVAGGAGVTIAIVDTGIDLDHPDLVDRLVAGYDLVDDDEVPDDENGHGTHVAGIAAATTNDIGIVGAAPLASLMPIRVLDAQGSGSDEQIAAGIAWAVEHGADVINLSLGEAGFLSRFTKGGVLNQAIRSATASGAVVIAAAGNEGSTGRQYRIGVDLLVVNATDRDDTVASFSNVGDSRAISAPGVDIVSTAPLTTTTLWPTGSTSGYEVLDGTSMATPLVAGAAALALSAGIPAADVIDRLMETARQPSDDPELGAGILDAGAALGTPVDEPEAPAHTPPTSTPAPTRPRRTVPAPTIPPLTTPPAPDGAGAITVHLGSPVDIDTSLPAPVTCSVEGRRYDATVDTTELNDVASIAASISVLNHRGPGSYPATGSVTVRTAATETSLPIAGVVDIDADLGGTIVLDDQSLDVSLGWTCPKPGTSS